MAITIAPQIVNIQRYVYVAADIIMPRSTINTLGNQTKPQRPETDTDEPDLPKHIPPDLSNNPSINEDLIASDLQLEADINLTGLAVSDGEFLPIFKVQPHYPQRALKQGIEGHVVVEFTVTATGAVADVKVISAQPQHYFEKAAIAAAKKFKYRPRMVDSQAVAVTGVRNKITFVIDNNQR